MPAITVEKLTKTFVVKEKAAGLRGSLRSLFNAFTEKQEILHLLDSSLEADGVQIFIGEESAWREFAPATTCKAGRYSVRVVVGGGVVREARPVGGAASASPSQRLCAAELIIDLEIEGVVDGEFPAEIVVEPRGSGE